MTDSTGTPSTPAGWYADPAGSDRLRWWDGTRWTDHLADAPAASAAAAEPAAARASGHVAPEAPAAPASAPPAYGQQAHGQAYAQQPYSQAGYAPTPYAAPTPPPQVPASTSPFTWAIWVLAALPVISLFLILGLDLRQTMTPMQYGRGAMSPDLGLSAGYLVANLVAFLVYGANVAVAYFDWRDLGQRGIVRPFHWAWTFLGSGVYVIGRSVIVRRRITGNPSRVLAPLWLWVGITAIVLFVAVVKWVDAFISVMQMYGPTRY
ncbi:DUF2510 domain-containing protein [Clavibacter michiganensis]|uniref:Membrane protein n=3 Tax=Clavibacter michiganensis TaxID=28447 RepID=A0A0D5CFZ7_9MICO|nr:DUF2510 domain-containing protein [Clavibacter michiganensis]AJW78157.1 membrane protein [Clavibacter michiganensis subsp. insidiosus]AWF99443.1 membrane protein [Clavibacter michiganensis subsp. insidiosus]AWG00439.1 membrane protein [Clavibacter michiganensis subsp. insidiosus]OQJ60939.1 hypothetical protein B5P21_14175 [Clavibacter michiganensis subsp. insidiosus]RMC83835.1 DUF2510 domain-containing protein [Clavibacter michiganensis subsp. insidiosus]